MQINKNSYSQFLAGVSSYGKMQYQSAIDHFIKSIQCETINNSKQTSNICNKLYKHSLISSCSFQTLSNLSSCLIKAKQYHSAMTVCNQLIKLNPYFSLSYFNMASIHIRQEKYLQAIGSIKCAISCEYLREYERLFDKEYLDKAIYYAHNNLQAIKFRIAHNYQLLNFTKNQSNSSKRQEEIQKAISQLESDDKQYKKFKNIYEVKFYQKQKTQTVNQHNFFISSIRPQFILESLHNYENHQNGSCKIENKLLQMKELKQLRDLYLQLLQSNDSQRDFSQFIDQFIIEQRQSEKNKERQVNYNTRQNDWNIIETNIFDDLVTLQTSFELQDSSDSVPFKNYNSYQPKNSSLQIQSKKTIKNTRNPSISNSIHTSNKQNIKSHSNKKLHHFSNSLLLGKKLPINQKRSKYENKYINQASQEEQLKTSRNQQKKCQNNSCGIKCQSRCEQAENLNSSIISILDYDEGPGNFNINQNYHPQPTMVESIIIRQPTELITTFNQIPRRNQSQITLMKNRSHQNLFASTLLSSASRKLSISRYQQLNQSLIQSKSHLKLLSCSKCSVDHSNSQHLPKNVKLNINLTQIYNYNGDYNELQTFCVVKHLDQQYRTQTSKGRFPNWKQPLSLHVSNLDHLSYHCQEQRRIKIQLWAKSINSKKDSSSQSLYGQQLIGQQWIDLREEKWMKRKIILQTKSSGHEKKTAYMYVCLEKIRE